MTSWACIGNQGSWRGRLLYVLWSLRRCAAMSTVLQHRGLFIVQNWLHGPSPGPFLLSCVAFCLYFFSLFFSVHCGRLSLLLQYKLRIVSYRISRLTVACADQPCTTRKWVTVIQSTGRRSEYLCRRRKCDCPQVSIVSRGPAAKRINSLWRQHPGWYDWWMKHGLLLLQRHDTSLALPWRLC